jgi:hypothetical protein
VRYKPPGKLLWARVDDGDDHTTDSGVNAGDDILAAMYVRQAPGGGAGARSVAAPTSPQLPPATSPLVAVAAANGRLAGLFTAANSPATCPITIPTPSARGSIATP